MGHHGRMEITMKNIVVLGSTGSIGTQTMDIVREHFSEDEINTTFSVLEAWLDIRRKVQDNRNARKKAKKR